MDEEKMDEEKVALDLEWERRVLCSDGSCIGVIGSDGKCKECGKPYEGELPDFGDLEGAASGEPGSAVEVEDFATPENETETAASDEASLDEEWENRRLCSDGSCIGVIGPDGRCKECGKPYEG